MSGPPDYSVNPFVPPPPKGFVPLPDRVTLMGSPPRNDPYEPGVLLSPQELAALASAPRRPAGTEVTVRAAKVPATADLKDHMFVEYDDGRNPLIARGGPTRSGLGMLSGWLDGSDRVGARVDPAPLSPDYGAGYRTVAKTFLPGVSAEQAAAPARAHAQGVNRGGNTYDWNSNSNSYAADDAEPIFGYRPGDSRTPGYQTHLRDGGTAPPAPLDLLSNWAAQLPDLSPLLRYPS